jgi:DNA-binding response OmpR family regulator
MSSTEHSPFVVVVDDNADLRQMLALALGAAGFVVCEAGTEIELQRILRHIQPDALLIDLQRSETDGLHLVARMHARASLSSVPIVLLAGTDADDFRQEAVRAGADWFALRPVRMAHLQRRMRKLLAHRRAVQRATTRKRVS